MAPVFRNGQVVEYLSVRYKPTIEQIRSSETLYRAIRDGKVVLGAIKLWQKPADWWSKIKLRTRNMILGLGALTATGLSVYASNKGMSDVLMYSQIALFPLVLLLMQTLRNVLGQVERADEVMKRMAEGVYNDQVELNREDEVGEMLRALKTMQINLCHSIADANDKAESAMRIQQALDGVTSNVMVADTDYNIIYMNNTVQEMFTSIESDLKKDLPNFNASTLMGTNMDVFHKNPAHQRSVLDSLVNTYKSTIKVGGRTLTVTANPVVNEKGERRGTVLSGRIEQLKLQLKKRLPIL